MGRPSTHPLGPMGPVVRSYEQHNIKTIESDIMAVAK
jgi:hypothetical protein